jgi:F-type H+-transporting ATPase subunit gamma
MAQTQALNRRIRSVKNAKQITKAMEVVAASRMRRVQMVVNRARDYADVALSIMRRVAPSQEAQQHPFFKPAKNANQLFIVFSSDRGLAGAFNSNVFHTAVQSIKEVRAKGGKASVIVFGRKGARFFAKVKDIELIADYDDVADTPEINVFAPVMQSIYQGFENGEFSGVNLIYTQFTSSLIQKVQLLQLLPVDLPAASEVEGAAEKPDTKVYEFEPDIEAVLDEALRLYFESQLMRARVESAASEYAMRMIAMGNANRNASDLIDNLTLELNSLRQASITQEIAEITGGASAIAV